MLSLLLSFAITHPLIDVRVAATPRMLHVDVGLKDEDLEEGGRKVVEVRNKKVCSFDIAKGCAFLTLREVKPGGGHAQGG